MVVKLFPGHLITPFSFESSVILYGSQAVKPTINDKERFESSVILYGSQAIQY